MQEPSPIIKSAVFITSDEILHIDPIKFLRNSPFVLQPSERSVRTYSKMSDTDPAWESSFDILTRQLQAIAITESGRHVILQQAGKSCVAASVAMLILDHGRIPDYESIKTAHLAEREDAIAWIKRAGLTPKMTGLQSQENKKEVLVECLAKHGSGVLAIHHPVIKGHVIVLDEISLKDNTAIVRDSFHGWSLTIKLDALLLWIDPFAYFLQITEQL